MLASHERAAATDLEAFPDVAHALLENPKSFEFFEAVQILTKLYPQRPEPGQSTTYDRELIHFRSWPALIRSPSDIRSLERIVDPNLPTEYRMEVAFMGLYGLSAPTPTYFWEHINRNRDSPLRDFLDIFNTRIIGLFFRAWKRYRWHLNHRGGLNDGMTRRAFCLIGLGTELSPAKADFETDSLENDAPVLAQHRNFSLLRDPSRLLAYAGILAQRSKPPVNLRSLLWDFLEGPDPRREPFVRIEENVLQWAYLDPNDLTRLGERNSQSGSGYSFIAGSRIPDRMGAFRIHLGPLALTRFLQFLPGGEAFRQLGFFARLGSPFGTEFDICLELRAEDIPEWRMGSAIGGRLGWTTWAGTRSEPGIVLLRPGIRSRETDP